MEHLWGKIRQVYPPKNFLSPISLKVRESLYSINHNFYKSFPI